MNIGMAFWNATYWFSRVLEGFGWRDLLDIALVAVIVTYLLRAMRGTRAFQMLRGRRATCR